VKLRALAALIGLSILASTNAWAQVPPPNPAARTPVAPLTVVDSTGKTVGRFGYPDLVYLNINSQLFATPLGNRDNTFASGLDFAQRPVYFETTNCTGTAYISVQAFGVRTAVMAKVGGLNGQAVAFIASGDLAQRIWRSSANWNGAGYVCSSQGDQVEFLYPTTPVDITGMFREPFVIQ
jgi:hypothetical protein